MKPHLMRSALLAVLYCVAGVSYAAPLAVTLPPETAKLRPYSEAFGLIVNVGLPLALWLRYGAMLGRVD